MKNKVLIIVSFLMVISSTGYAQQEISWMKLAHVKWKTAYVQSLDGYYSLPKFNSEIRALNGKFVKIKGFCMPLDVDGKTFALSAQPSSMCFFCNGAGPESVIEVVVTKYNKEFNKMKTDKYIEIKGIFKLNKEDPDHLMYLMEDTHLMRIIK